MMMLMMMMMMRMITVTISSCAEAQILQRKPLLSNETSSALFAPLPTAR
uniref:Secreted protein n=1 Tax=Anguilla anguilla TaxID=7936 RepID=A0A0E9VGQ8_ANGAN